uniref:Uncharacterized protein n=1 Tax=Rhizophagus irregularis (strain DAOM 181602 / DAOM 197198 / MUCL 43194) TaxID=747089 RepID=U9U4B6_RHIID
MISFNYVFSKLLSNEECYACDFVITTVIEVEISVFKRCNNNPKMHRLGWFIIINLTTSQEVCSNASPDKTPVSQPIKPAQSPDARLSFMLWNTFYRGNLVLFSIVKFILKKFVRVDRPKLVRLAFLISPFGHYDYIRLSHIVFRKVLVFVLDLGEILVIDVEFMLFKYQFLGITILAFLVYHIPCILINFISLVVLVKFPVNVHWLLRLNPSLDDLVGKILSGFRALWTICLVPRKFLRIFSSVNSITKLFSFDCLGVVLRWRNNISVAVVFCV